MRERLRAWFPAIVWMGAIFFFSTDLFAAPRTMSVTQMILHWLFPFLSQEAVVRIHLGLRKGAHMATYGVLTMLYARALVRTAAPAGAWTGKKVLLSLLFSVVYALTDEWHQSLSEARTASLGDVGWDSAGAAAAALALRFRKIGASGGRAGRP